MTPVPGSSHGGAEALGFKRLTAAQILTLHTTAVELVPAQGAGTVVIPLGLYIALTAGATPYDVTNAPSYTLQNGTYGLYSREASDSLGSAVDYFEVAVLGTGIYDDAASHFANIAVSVKLSAAVTLGDGTVRLTVPYIVVSF